jgi:cobaltochelatase CobT
MLLLDASGSMNGSKWVHAIKSAELINATVCRGLGIPLEVLAFTDDYTGSVIYEGKRFNNRHVGDDDMVKRLSYATSYMSGNADGEAVLFAYNRLRERREKRRVMIVVSDGAPACSRPGNIDKFTKDVIESIEADPHIEIYGLGLMSTSVKHYYKRHVTVDYGGNLEEALLSLIDKAIV